MYLYWTVYISCIILALYGMYRLYQYQEEVIKALERKQKREEEERRQMSLYYSKMRNENNNNG